jgi:hypothetical protein
MQPHEISVTLGADDTRALLGDQAAEIRALKTVLAAYITHFGPLPGAAPAEPVNVADAAVLYTRTPGYVVPAGGVPAEPSPAESPATAPRKLRQEGA